MSQDVKDMTLATLNTTIRRLEREKKELEKKFVQTIAKKNHELTKKYEREADKAVFEERKRSRQWKERAECADRLMAHIVVALTSEQGMLDIKLASAVIEYLRGSNMPSVNRLAEQIVLKGGDQ